jgi:hypothetical protein
MPKDARFPRFAEEFRALDRHPPVTLALSAMEAWCLLSQLQLALRHPANTGPTAALARQVAERLQAATCRPGSALHEVAEAAWHGE